MEFEIRPMTEGDIAAVLAIAESLPEAPKWAREAYEAALKHDAESALRRVAVVAETAYDPYPKRVVAGFAVASVVARTAELESIAVEKPAQRHGAGAALLQALISELRSAGAQELTLEMRVSNKPAKDLYAQAGFRETGRRRGYYQNPVEDAVLLRLPLTA
jgi:[ribosomal protein S18]-alanine N-acetyltransferase